MIAFIAGMFVGLVIGVVVISLCVVARWSDDGMER